LAKIFIWGSTIFLGASSLFAILLEPLMCAMSNAILNAPRPQILNSHSGQSNTDKKFLRTQIFHYSNLHRVLVVYLQPLLRPLSGMYSMRAIQKRKAAALVVPMSLEGERETEGERLKLLKSM
jgi:hypothetical protein